VTGAIAAALAGLAGKAWSNDPTEAPFEGLLWPPDLRADQDEAVYELCLANGGIELFCAAKQQAIIFWRQK
jgi:hypothetical protein